MKVNNHSEDLLVRQRGRQKVLTQSKTCHTKAYPLQLKYRSAHLLHYLLSFRSTAPGSNQQVMFLQAVIRSKN